ncbi:hypothetical protein GCM10011529_19160 [Polymorphobacter glacialis]|uniref:Uncharacterized protein n=1 Tax=Sandarakinorhabdus glacialis TaxID=1614636 RepID=A0A916ZT51_9SPHN|nr:hypothetical protein [Polymorphobacter glacialis]GGE12954.1 hypothetical protein GCM10011529_19160 [Polymorphobacter glacialis]
MAATPGVNVDTNDFEQVVADPAAFYLDPEAILADSNLSRAERLRLLREWAQDIADRQNADNEGMAAEAPAKVDETGLLRRVNAAIERVEGETDASIGIIERVWRRLTR